MKSPYIKSELIITFLLLALIFACSIPGMSNMMYTSLHILTTIVFGTLAFFLFRTKAQDEREETNRAQASEISFLMGGGAILATVVYQSINSLEISRHLFVILLVMVLTRFILRIYFDKTK